jgi:hypothetical protein
LSITDGGEKQPDLNLDVEDKDPVIAAVDLAVGERTGMEEKAAARWGG